jgi:hypothetical protein
VKLLVLGIAALAIASSAASRPAAPPALRLVRATPTVDLRGVRFHARERVRVTLTHSDARRTRIVRSSASGTFTVSFGPIAGFDPCNDVLFVVAIGGTGDRATLKYLGRECPPAP